LIKNKHAGARGFTLIEILIVVVIIGLLASLVGPSLFKKVGTSRQKTAMAQITMLETALKMFRLDIGRYPTTEEGLKALVAKLESLKNWDGPYLEKDLPLDPWGNSYLYKCPGEKTDYEITSYGGDGKAGGDGENKDIFSWEIK
jgi:general secretion pathway protein G